MKFKKILITDFSESEFTPYYWERLDSFADKRICLSPDSPDLQKHYVDTDCLLVKFNPASKEIIDNFSNLKYIGVLGTGFGKVDTVYAKQKSII